MLKINFINYYLLIISIIATFSTNASNEIQIKTINPAVKINKRLYFFDEEGEKHGFEEYENQFLLVVFWAKWSVFCSRYLLDLDELQDDFKKLPFKVLAISEDHQGIQVAKKFYQEHNIKNLKLLYDYKNSLMNAMNSATIPSAFLIDKNSNVIVSFIGVVNWNDEEIRKFLLSYIDNNNKISQ